MEPTGDYRGNASRAMAGNRLAPSMTGGDFQTFSAPP